MRRNAISTAVQEEESEINITPINSFLAKISPINIKLIKIIIIGESPLATGYT